MAVKFESYYGADYKDNITAEICGCCGAYGTHGGKLRTTFPGFYVVANPTPEMETGKLLNPSKNQVNELDFVVTKQGTIAVFSRRYV